MEGRYFRKYLKNGFFRSSQLACCLFGHCKELVKFHPGIQEVQVFGVPDPRFGEQVCAWITPHVAGQLDEDEIRSFCRERITYFKTPHYRDARAIDDELGALAWLLLAS